MSSIFCPSVVELKFAEFERVIKQSLNLTTAEETSVQINHGWKKRAEKKTYIVDVLLITGKYFFCFILLTYEGSHREVYWDFLPSLTSSAGGAEGCSGQFPCTPSLHCPIANSASTQRQQPV